MQDIILDSKTGNYARRRRFLSGILRTGLLAVVLGLLVCLDFVLYMRSGSVFVEKGEIHMPTLICCAYLFGGAVLLMIVTSFSRWLQTVIFALCGAVLAWGFMNQFLQIDKAQYLTVVTAPFINPEIAGLFEGYSHWIISAIVFIILYYLIDRLSSINLFYLAGILAFVTGGLLGTGMMLAEPKPQVSEVYKSTDTDFAEGNNKIVFLFMPDSASYTALATGSKKDIDKSKLLQRVELGFLLKYGFKLYPNAYMTTDNQDSNLVELLNLLDNKSYSDHLLNNVGLEGLWKFKAPKKTEVFLQDNQLQDVFKKAKYKVSAYQNQRFEICKKNSQYTVDRCLNRANLPFDVRTGISEDARVDLLLAQWVSSLDILNQTLVNVVHSIAGRNVAKTISLPYNQMYVVNSFDVLQRLLDDISADAKSGVYFVYFEFPNNLMVYNEWCQLKSQNYWEVLNPKVKVPSVSMSRGAYNEQMLCFWGQMDELMQKLTKIGATKNMTFVLQGLNGLQKSDDGGNFVNNFKNSNTVLMAIRSPQAKFGVNHSICRSKDILRHYLFNAPKCTEFNGLPVPANLQDTIRTQFDDYRIKKPTLLKAMKAYGEWFDKWKGKRVPLFKIHKIVAEPEPVAPVTDDEMLTDDAVNALTVAIPNNNTETVVKEPETQAKTVSEEAAKDVSAEDIEEDENIELPQPAAEPSVDEKEEVEAVAPAEKTEVKEEKSKVDDVPLEHSKPEGEVAKEKVVTTVSAPSTQKVEGQNTQKVENTVTEPEQKVEAPVVVEQQPVEKIVVEVPATVEEDTETIEVREVVVPQQSTNVSVDFLLEGSEEEWELDPAKALGVSGDETPSEQIIIKVK